MILCGPGLTAATAGQTYNLNDGAEIRLLAYDLGLAPVRRLAQRTPQQAGDTDLGFRVDPRFVDLAWALKGTGLIDYRNIRGRFMEVWVPRSDAVVLTFTFEDRVRALNLHLDGEFNFGDRSETVELVSGVFKASDPRLYDPTAKSIRFDLAGTGAGAGWGIPWVIPWAMGTDVINLSLNVLYAGGSRLAAAEYPRITIFGPITNPVIWNVTTNEDIDLTGLTLASPAEWVEIDLGGPDRRDSKTIRNQAGASMDHYLSLNSDLATFHLAPAGEKLFNGSWATGENVIRVTGTGVTSQTLVTLNYFDRYNGV